MRITAVLSLSVVILCGARGTAAASPIYFSTASASVTYHGSPANSDSETEHVPSGTSAGPVNAALSGASASASVTDVGTTVELHAFAMSPYGFLESANGFAQFSDTLFVPTSIALPAGTPVQWFAELAFSGSVTPNGVTGPCIGGAVVYGGLDASNSQGNAGSLLVQDHTCDSSDINNPSGLIQGFAGEELFISVFLNAGVGAPEVGAYFSGLTADAANTLGFFLTPIGDFTYSTASGNNYINQVQPVPEPSSLLLFGSGLTFAVSRLRRRSTRR